MITKIEELDSWVARNVTDINFHNTDYTTSAALYMMFYAGMKFQLEQTLAKEKQDPSTLLDNMANWYEQ